MTPTSQTFARLPDDSFDGVSVDPPDEALDHTFVLPTTRLPALPPPLPAFPSAPPGGLSTAEPKTVPLTAANVGDGSLQDRSLDDGLPDEGGPPALPLLVSDEPLVDESADALLPLPTQDILEVAARPARQPMPADRSIINAPPTAPASTFTGTDAHAPGSYGEGVVCPFCAHVRPADAAEAPCPRCTMQDTASTRRSTGERIGPWFVLQRKNPTAPGLRFSVLLTLARRGHVTPRSIVRGPTTGQLWRYAAQVKGLSRVFGVCWHCSSGVSPDATTCPRCRSAQEIPDDPDVFLENYASLPVMRDVPASVMSGPTDSPVAELPAPMQETPTFGSRQITAPAAATNTNDPRGRRLAGSQAAVPARPIGERRMVPPKPPLAATAAPANLPARRTPALPAALGNESATQAIMSASELAAVFQLEGPAGRRGASHPIGRLILRTLRVAFILALVLAVGGVAVAFVRPDWAAQARAYAEPRGRAVWAKVLALTAHPAAAANDATAKSPAHADQAPPTTPIEFADTPGQRDLNAPRRIGNAPATAPSRHETMVMDSAGHPMPARPANPFPRNGANALPPTNVQPQLDGLGGAASTFTPAPRPTPAPIAINAPTTRPANPTPPIATPAAPAPAPTPPPPAKHELTLDEAITQAGALRNDALDAEARKDWRAAVMIYEQIMRLPEAAWPSDVKPRLEIARQNLAR